MQVTLSCKVVQNIPIYTFLYFPIHTRHHVQSGQTHYVHVFSNFRIDLLCMTNVGRGLLDVCNQIAFVLNDKL